MFYSIGFARLTDSDVVSFRSACAVGVSSTVALSEFESLSSIVNPWKIFIKPTATLPGITARCAGWQITSIIPPWRGIRSWVAMRLSGTM